MRNEDKREFPRIELTKKGKAKFKVPNQMDLGLASIKNISGGGVCLLTTRPLDVTTIITIEFNIPGESESILADGEIVWVDIINPPVNQFTHQLGIRFIRIDDRKKEAVTRFVVRYLKSKVSDGVATAKKRDKKRHSILIIDDDKVTRRVVNEVFSDQFEVFTAANGLAGVEIAKDKRPDLILLDIIMPDFDGFSTLMMLKDFPETCDIPVIMLSVVRDKGAIFQALREGATDYLLKPFTSEKIVDKITSTIYSKKKETKSKS